MTSKHLHELIDACRPGHEDVNQPELGELERELSQDPSLQRLFQRSQELDEAIRTAFQAVTPPPGLAERIIAAVETPAIANSETSSANPESESRVELATGSARRSIGIWAGVASLVAVAAVITLWFSWTPPVSLTSERDIAEIVDRWNAELDAESWQAAANLPVQDFPTWQPLQLGSDDRWQWVSNRRIVCYDFDINPKKNGEIVRLFVIKPTGPIALQTAPPVGYPSPNKWHVGAWQANGRVYYLAVNAQGDSKGLYSRVIASRFNPA